MAEAVPSCLVALTKVMDRLVDLLPIVRNNVYHPDFAGSFSIKSVLPALVTGLGYSDLDIGDGATAQAVLERLLLSEGTIEPQERRKLRTQLLAYCERDTLAMVKLLEVLRTLT
jgi:predicted RecB family nuclease